MDPTATILRRGSGDVTDDLVNLLAEDPEMMASLISFNERLSYVEEDEDLKRKAGEPGVPNSAVEQKGEDEECKKRPREEGNDRSLRKKEREKMRRLEVNTKLEELISLLDSIDHSGAPPADTRASTRVEILARCVNVIKQMKAALESRMRELNNLRLMVQTLTLDMARMAAEHAKTQSIHSAQAGPMMGAPYGNPYAQPPPSAAQTMPPFSSFPMPPGVPLPASRSSSAISQNAPPSGNVGVAPPANGWPAPPFFSPYPYPSYPPVADPGNPPSAPAAMVFHHMAYWAAAQAAQQQQQQQQQQGQGPGQGQAPGQGPVSGPGPGPGPRSGSGSRPGSQT
uniref:BHLH domain-containing protein n=1 Tax=Pinguiococcus pyrenoidosus TaxID=172671 RepID=A0A7R9UBA6_9STRA|mmetsp:Transcript_4163/g.16191  ORF Transcript_4163/g.16191 Transcript_4163/m.16191 type:complete len:340 (+) Transcript_4163:92-1111(+)